MKFGAALVGGAFALGVTAGAVSAQQLYETGPAKDIGLVRFVNASNSDATVRADGKSQRELKIPVASPVTNYQAVPTDTPVTGTWTAGANRLQVGAHPPAGGAATVVVWTSPSGKLASKAISEHAQPFDGQRASLAFYNLDPSCSEANLISLKPHRPIFEKRPALSALRRAVNPIPLQVRVTCADGALDQGIDVGQMEAGQRYSVFLVPGPGGRRLIGVIDQIAH